MSNNMLKNIRMIGLDLDDTVLNSDKQMTQKVQDAIKKAVDAGITVLPVTGRSYSALPKEFIGIPGVSYAVCSNGAIVYDADNKEMISQCGFSKENAFKVLDICEEHNVVASVFMENDAYSEQDINYEELLRVYDDIIIEYFIKSRVVVKSLKELVETSESVVQKFTLIFYDPSIRDEIRRIFEEKGLCEVTSSLKDNLELNAPGVNKGRALLDLGEKLGISQAEIMAIGDGSNDLEMIRSVGYGVAMGNACDELKEIAKHVTCTADQDGVAVVIEEVLNARV